MATAAGAAEPPMAYASLDGGLRSLFQTDRRQGAISEGVAKIWQGRNAGAAAARPAPTYFPRSDAAEDVVQTAAIPDAADPVVSSPILVPLPPRRPAGLGQAAATTASAEPNPAARPSKTVFFDLSSYNLRNGP